MVRRQKTPILELLARENEALLVRRDALALARCKPGGACLGIVDRQHAPILELLVRENQALLVRRGALLVPDRGHAMVDRVRGLTRRINVLQTLLLGVVARHSSWML